MGLFCDASGAPPASRLGTLSPGEAPACLRPRIGAVALCRAHLFSSESVPGEFFASDEHRRIMHSATELIPGVQRHADLFGVQTSGSGPEGGGGGAREASQQRSAC